MYHKVFELYQINVTRTPDTSKENQPENIYDKDFELYQINGTRTPYTSNENRPENIYNMFESYHKRATIKIKTFNKI